MKQSSPDGRLADGAGKGNANPVHDGISAEQETTSNYGGIAEAIDWLVIFQPHRLPGAYHYSSIPKLEFRPDPRRTIVSELLTSNSELWALQISV